MENLDLFITTAAIVIAFAILIVGTFGEFKNDKKL